MSETEQQNNNKVTGNGSLVRNGSIWGLYILMIISSALIVFSALEGDVFSKSGMNTFPMIKHLLLLLGSLSIVAFMSSKFSKLENKHNILKWSLIVYSIFTVIGLALLPILGTELNGAKRWYLIFGISLQPSDFCKISFIFLGAYFANRANNIGYKIKKIKNNKSKYSIDEYDEILEILNKKQGRNYFWLYFISALIIFLIFISNISTAVIYTCYLFMFTIIAKPPKYVWKKLGLVFVIIFVFGGGAFFAASQDWIHVGRLNTAYSRLFGKENQKQDTITDKNGIVHTISIEGEASDQENVAKIAISNGKIFGLGINKSKTKKALPMASSDYIFAVAYEEIGIFAIIILVFIFGYWMLVANEVANNTPYSIWRYTAFGIGLFYPLQVAVNLLVASGMISTGQPIPIIGMGGSSIFSSSLAIALLLLINNITNDNNKNKLKEEQLDIDESNN